MIFIHIPKTAGQSIAKATKGLVSNLGHKELSKLDDAVVCGQHIMTVVRNPYDRAVSSYYYMKHMHGNMPFAGEVYQSLNGFWKNAYDGKERWLRMIYFKPQIDFISDDNKQVSQKITTILRYETLGDDLNDLAASNGFSPLEHLNSSKLRLSKHWREELNEESISIIGEIYAQDFEALGYDRL